MIQIDGSFGEGGGQILRTSIALSMITSKPIEIINIRANRTKPGLQNQHLAAVKAASQVCAADVNGLSIGSSKINFSPNQTTPGNYYFDIGTAGSTTLVLQTLIYSLSLAQEKSRIRVSGGTHNPFAPTADFLKRTYLPCLAKLGIKTKFKLERYGFYPKGGGVVELEITPCDRKNLNTLHLNQENTIEDVSAAVILANLPEHVAKRELKVISDNLKKMSKSSINKVDRTRSPGNVVSIFAKSKDLTETFSQLGSRGVKAEEVATKALNEFLEYSDSKVPIGQHLADQLLIPMALSGSGEFLTLPPTEHTKTNIYTIQKFLDVNITFNEVNENQYLVKLDS